MSESDFDYGGGVFRASHDQRIRRWTATRAAPLTGGKCSRISLLFFGEYSDSGCPLFFRENSPSFLPYLCYNNGKSGKDG